MMHSPGPRRSPSRSPSLCRLLAAALLALSCGQRPSASPSTPPIPFPITSAGPSDASPPALPLTVTLREPYPWLAPDSCAFAGKNGAPIALSSDGTLAGVFATLHEYADVNLELGAPGGPARIRADVAFVQLDTRVLANDVQLFPKKELTHQGVFHAVSSRRVRVRSVEQPGVLQIAPSSWDTAPVRFRSPTPWSVSCDTLRLEASAPVEPPSMEKRPAWLEAEVRGVPTTLTAKPGGPPVLDVLKGFEVRIVAGGAQTRVTWDTADGRFFAVADERSLSRRPAMMGLGAGAAFLLARRTPFFGCKDSMSLYAVSESDPAAGAVRIGRVPSEGNLKVLENAPWTSATGETLVFVELRPPVKSAPGIRFVVKDGPGVQCRRLRT